MTVSSLLSSIILKCFLALGIMKESSHQVNYMISSFTTSLSTRLTPCISVEYVYRQWDTLYGNQFSFFLRISLSIYLASQLAPPSLFLQLLFLAHFSLLSFSLCTLSTLSSFSLFCYLSLSFSLYLFLPNFSILSLPSVFTYLSLSTPFHYSPTSLKLPPRFILSTLSIYPLSLTIFLFISQTFFLPPFFILFALSLSIYISSLQLSFSRSLSTLSLYSHCTPISTLSKLSLFLSPFPILSFLTFLSFLSFSLL